MTPDQLALLATILANPADDAPRKVYADYIEENGEPERAEFIHVQIEIARLESLGAHQGRSCNVTGVCSECHREAEHRDLRRRERELLDEYWGRWIRGIGIVPTEWKLSTDGEDFHIWRDNPFDDGFRFKFSRGFISRIECTAATWLRIAPLLVWREGDTMTCPQCDGDGLATGPPECRPCRYCRVDGRSTGTVPRPMPPTAQPIERVRLTTEPNEREFGAFKNINWGAMAAEYYRWPGIVFELPDAVRVIN